MILTDYEDAYGDSCPIIWEENFYGTHDVKGLDLLAPRHMPTLHRNGVS